MQSLKEIFDILYQSQIYSITEYAALKRLLNVDGEINKSKLLSELIKLYTTRIHNYIDSVVKQINVPTALIERETLALVGICRVMYTQHGVSKPWLMLINGMNIELQRRLGIRLLFGGVDQANQQIVFHHMQQNPILKQFISLPRSILTRLLLLQMMADDLGYQTLIDLGEAAEDQITDAEITYLRASQLLSKQQKLFCQLQSAELHSRAGIKKFFQHEQHIKTYIDCVKQAGELILSYSTPVLQSYREHLESDNGPFVYVKQCLNLDQDKSLTNFADVETLRGDFSEITTRQRLIGAFAKAIQGNMRNNMFAMFLRDRVYLTEPPFNALAQLLKLCVVAAHDTLKIATTRQVVGVTMQKQNQQTLVKWKDKALAEMSAAEQKELDKNKTARKDNLHKLYTNLQESKENNRERKTAAQNDVTQTLANQAQYRATYLNNVAQLDATIAETAETAHKIKHWLV